MRGGGRVWVIFCGVLLAGGAAHGQTGEKANEINPPARSSRLTKRYFIPAEN
jgi:hypothetical protein